MAKTKTVIVLPTNRRMKEVEAWIAKTEKAGSTVNGLYDELVTDPVPGLTDKHASVFAARMQAIKEATWKANNPLAKKYGGPAERRADATYIRKVLAFSACSSLKQWAYLCGLTNAYNTRANIAGEAATYYAKHGKMPGNAWFDNEYKNPKKKRDSNNAVTKASAYLQRIVDTCGKLKANHPKVARDMVVNMLKSAKQALAIAVEAETPDEE